MARLSIMSHRTTKRHSHCSAGWIFTLGVFLFVVNATYPTAGLGGSVLIGGLATLIFVARAARPSAQPQPTTLTAYGRAVLGKLVDEFALVPGSAGSMYHRDLVQRGRAPSDREQAVKHACKSKYKRQHVIFVS